MDCSDEDFLNACPSGESLKKQPFKRLEFALKQVTQVAIPFHVQLLKEQSKNIEFSKIDGNQLQLHSEQIKAANAVRLLKSDLHELEEINAQVRCDDSELFQRQIESPTREVIEVLSEFMEMHSDVLQPFPEFEIEEFQSVTELKCYSDQVIECENSLPPITPYSSECQNEKGLESSGVLKHWLLLKKELCEVNMLIKKFASLVFLQGEQVNNIEKNVLQARENVVDGTNKLRRAAILKTASIPIVGAVLGGILLGPIGALAGFKLVGTAACAAGGGILGYSAGCKVKKQKLKTYDIELRSLTYPSKTISLSSPELSQTSDKITTKCSEKKED